MPHFLIRISAVMIAWVAFVMILPEGASAQTANCPNCAKSVVPSFSSPTIRQPATPGLIQPLVSSRPLTGFSNVYQAPMNSYRPQNVTNWTGVPIGASVSPRPVVTTIAAPPIRAYSQPVQYFRQPLPAYSMRYRSFSRGCGG